MHHESDIDHVLCDSFEIFNVSQESSIDLYREGSVFRNLQIPQFKTTKVSNQQWSNGWWDCFPKKTVQKLETQLFGGEKFGRFLIHSGQTLSKLAFQSYSRFVVVRESTMAYSWGWWTPIGEWTCRMKKIGKFSQLKLKESVHFYI